MVRDGIHLAETTAEKEAVYRFRYEIYVQELDRLSHAADHERKMLVEPEDATARIFYAAKDGAVVATSRLSWGGDAPFNERLIRLYSLEPFLAELPAEAMAVGERGMVKPEHRGSSLFQDLGEFSAQFISDKRIQLVFGICEPHLLSLYISRGMRTYAKRNICSADAGYFIPVVTVVEDVEYLRRIGAPNAATVKDWGADTRVPACVDRLITHGGNVTSERLIASTDYLAKVRGALGGLAEHQLSALDGLSEEAAERALGKSNILHCHAGDRVVKKGSVTRNMYVVLEGNLEVRDDDDRLIRVLSRGDVFGEMAFLLERPRSAHVDAATDCRVLCLSESTIRHAIADNSALAARLLLNVSKILCKRILEKG